ncbi:glycosyl transferase group 1 [Pyrobaculum neutrophilum V24Sta]|uniref:Glycosyl transferase group 1 n=2 Tax=Pyrobaculum neutrophilum TaxID=70771 RepID=B1YCC0_PYRNV|nr:glycosyl transferase group 1 [Pyrobaculum neutrophilum V24Sta]
MHICYIHTNLWPYTYGGAELRHYLFAKELSKMGYKVTYITYDWGPTDIPTATVGPPPPLYDREGRRDIINTVKFSYAAAKKAKNLRCDKIDVTVPYLPAYLLPREKIILTYWEFWGDKWKDYYGRILGRMVMWGEKAIIKRAPLVITATKIVANQVFRYNRNTAIIPVGLNLDHYLVYRSHNKTYDLAYVARLVPYKGLDVLIEVLNAVGEKLRVLIIGDGPLRDRLAAEIKRMRHEVEWRRNVAEEDKRRLLAQAKIYLNLSKTEGFSIATLEAIALGAYPIVLDAEGYNAAREIVENLNYGYVAKTPAEVVKAIEEARPSPLEPEKLMQYHISNVVQQYIRLL